MTDKRLALEEGLGVCPRCHKLQKVEEGENTCCRCSATFHPRKPQSLQYTIAWTIAALVMFFPANIAPIMIFSTLGQPDPSTILSGISTFLKLGMYPVALIVFVASFIVPLGKIVGLFVLVHSAHFNSKLTKKKRAHLYHLVEFLGPWSMLDVFVVAIMAAVVNLGFLTSIEVGIGATYFTLMVVFTMFAAESFDPRLLWDSKKNDHKIEENSQSI